MKRMMFIAAAFAALVCCSKSETSQNPSAEPGTEETPAVVEYAFTEGETVTITAGASLTKVTSALNDKNGVDFKWESDDSIKVTVGEKSSVFKVSKLKDGGVNAEFTGKMPASGDAFDVQYPVIDPDLTEEQTYTSGEAIPHDAMKFTATGCTVEEPFELTAVNAAIRLNLWGTNKSVGTIVVTNTTSTDDPKPSYTLIAYPAITIGTTRDDSTSFFIVVPVGEWKFKAEIYDGSSASICSFETSSAKTFTANQILNMSAKKVGKFYPGTELEGIKIGNVTWAPVNCGYDASHTYGLLYQWGRQYGQDYDAETITPETLTKEQGEDSANSSKFGKYNSTNNNWFSGDLDDTLWNGSTKGTYDPCPSSWRVPTVDELGNLCYTDWNSSSKSGSTLRGSWDGTNNGWNFNTLFLPAAGSRYYYNGSASNRGDYGYYWCSSATNDGFAWLLGFYSGNALMGLDYRANGYSVRCVQE